MSMSDFDFNIDLEAELAGIRGWNKREPKPNHQPNQTRQQPPRQQPAKQKPQQQAKPERKPDSKDESRQDTHNRNIERQQHVKQGGGAASQPNRKRANQNGQQEVVVQAPTDPYEPEIQRSEEPEGLPVKHSQQESFRGGGSGASDTEDVNWKTFKTLPGIFEHVGGSRPVQLNPNIKKSQVSGIPEPFFMIIQEKLKERHVGAVIHFPWGEYKITEKNKVLTTKASLIRYLLFDALRDPEGTHVQFAKQWLALHHPAFEKEFDPDIHLKPNSDELDIYAMLFVVYTTEYASEVDKPRGVSVDLSESEEFYQMNERIGMMNAGMNRLLEKLNQQEEQLKAQTERESMIQTVLMLDRMGLLKGGLPRDLDELAGVLERNRDLLHQTDGLIDKHLKAEQERQKRLERERRMKMLQQQRLRRQ